MLMPIQLKNYRTWYRHAVYESEYEVTYDTMSQTIVLKSYGSAIADPAQITATAPARFARPLEGRTFRYLAGRQICRDLLPASLRNSADICDVLGVCR